MHLLIGGMIGLFLTSLAIGICGTCVFFTIRGNGIPKRVNRFKNSGKFRFENQFCFNGSSYIVLLPQESPPFGIRHPIIYFHDGPLFENIIPGDAVHFLGASLMRDS